jgi:hypothetical protein
MTPDMIYFVFTVVCKHHQRLREDYDGKFWAGFLLFLARFKLEYPKGLMRGKNIVHTYLYQNREYGYTYYPNNK